MGLFLTQNLFVASGIDYLIYLVVKMNSHSFSGCTRDADSPDSLCPSVRVGKLEANPQGRIILNLLSKQHEHREETRFFPGNSHSRRQTR